MIIRSSKPESQEEKREPSTENVLEECARKVVQHLERHIVTNRNNSEKANRLACMNKYIQVNYLSGSKKHSGV